MPRRMVVLLAFAVTVACSSNQTPVPVPTPIAPATTTESFSGTLRQFGNFQYQFKVNQNSEVHVTLKSAMTVAVDANPAADPPVAAKPAVPVSYPLTVTVGQTTISTLGVACTNLKRVTTAPGNSPQLEGQALAGTYCVDVSDSDGSLPEPITFTVTIAHS